MTKSQPREDNRVAPSNAIHYDTELSLFVCAPIDIHWSIEAGRVLTQSEVDRLGCCSTIVVGCGLEAAAVQGVVATAKPIVEAANATTPVMEQRQ